MIYGWHHFSFLIKCLVEFTSKVFGHGVFLRRIFMSDPLSLTNRRPLRCSFYSWVNFGNIYGLAYCSLTILDMSFVVFYYFGQFLAFDLHIFMFSLLSLSSWELIMLDHFILSQSFWILTSLFFNLLYFFSLHLCFH